MKPVKFRYRYSYSTLFPDHVATIKDHATNTAVYGVWWEHPEGLGLTTLHKVAKTHEIAARYATLFERRYTRARNYAGHMAMAAELATLQPPVVKKPWWLPRFLRRKS
jgi:hypothetical protein